MALLFALMFGAAMIGCGVLGVVIERFAYRPLRKAPRLNVLITAIGVSLLLQNTGQLKYVFGTQPQRMPAAKPMAAGATPNDTASASESRSPPSADDLPLARATLTAAHVS